MLLAVLKVLPLLEALPVGLGEREVRAERGDSKVLTACVFLSVVGAQYAGIML